MHAKDPDGDGVTYAITGGNEDSNFELDNQKGGYRRSCPLSKRTHTLTASQEWGSKLNLKIKLFFFGQDNKYSTRALIFNDVMCKP